MNDAVCHILRNNEITVRQLQVTLRVEMVTIGEDKTMCLYICKHDVYDSKTSKEYKHFEKTSNILSLDFHFQWKL